MTLGSKFGRDLWDVVVAAPVSGLGKWTTPRAQGSCFFVFWGFFWLFGGIKTRVFGYLVPEAERRRVF